MTQSYVANLLITMLVMCNVQEDYDEIGFTHESGVNLFMLKAMNFRVDSIL